MGDTIQQQGELNKTQSGDFDKQLKDVRDHVGSVQTQIQSSVCEAMRKQEARLNTRFDQLCEMLQGSHAPHGGKRPAVPSDDFDANMSPTKQDEKLAKK